MALRTTVNVTLTPFERHVKQALRLFNDPERLGRESPLAKPYMLVHALREVVQPTTARMCGDILRDELRHAAAPLWYGPRPTSHDEMLAMIATVRNDPDDSRYAYIVLNLRCFHELVTPDRTSDIWEKSHLLPGSKSQHYRDFDVAVKLLATLLLDRLRPAVRTERPRTPHVLYGYDRQLRLVIDALARGQTVAVSGPSGAGKTSLGAAAVAHLNQPTFWYTLRPGFNDGLNSLLFALGAFLHELGAANLWQYLATSNGIINDPNLATGLLRQDLATLAANPPIMCLDDLEHLTANNVTLLERAHTPVHDLIEQVRGLTPLLLISQRTVSASDFHIDLRGLSVADIEALWQAAGLAVSRDEATRLHDYTAGNPRLLTLVLALREQGDDAVPHFESVPSLLPAFQRLWRRLSSEERRMLQKLSVYRGYAPEEVIDAATLDALIRLRLVEQDRAGGVALLPALVSVVHADLSSELREALHEAAALVRLERGEHTAAAYHFVQCKQEHRAVQVWFPQRDQAIARGEADAARPVFDSISRQRLDELERRALDIIRTELRQLTGQHDAGLRDLESADWANQSEASAHLWMLRGQLEDALGYPDKAIESYGEGLRVTARLLAQTVSLRQGRGVVFHHKRELASTWHEINRAEVDLELLRGLIREEEGSYDAALESYRRVLEAAEQLRDEPLRAQAERKIAIVYGRRQHLEEAVAHAQRALDIYERLGDRVNLAQMHSNLAAIYVQTRQFRAALDVGAQAYAFFVAVCDPYFAAGAGANLAEASFELGDFDGAIRYAQEVLGMGVRLAAPYAQFTLGQVELARRSFDAAAEHFAESMRLAQENDDPYMVAYAQRALGQALLGSGRGEATQHLQAALARFQQLAIPDEIAATEQLCMQGDEVG